jgi:hypothetical protein
MIIRGSGFSGGRWLLSPVLFLLAAVIAAQRTAPDLAAFYRTVSRDDGDASDALRTIAAGWKHGYTPLLIDLARFLPTSRPRPAPGEDATTFRHPAAIVRARLIRFLERQTGQRFGDDLGRWREWMWALPYDPHPDYATFKGEIYARVDPQMRKFFPAGVAASIRLDEIDWGGVRVNEIPPLDHPLTIPAASASYLKGGHIVFGIVINGEARAYPKRILAWHEMARDRIGGVDLTIVYCTLCGTVVPYDSNSGGTVRTFGTSGLLYRSNKLMFDKESMSLWSALDGAPVVGSLAGSGLRLRPHPVVTTTWEEWRAEHPNSTVLSLETGHERDYTEGVAYRDYFATDRLMFRVPRTDSRLKNKDEVLAIRLPGAGRDVQPLAIAVAFLERNPVFHTPMGAYRLVVVTTPGGANRVYEAGDVTFVRLLDGRKLEDRNGRFWRVDEAGLTLDSGETRLARVPAHRAFWFAWYAQFPETMLIGDRR